MLKSIVFPAHFFKRLALFAAALPVALVSITALLLGLWIMPNIERYHTEIETLASRALGTPVTIEKISADWYGVNPRLRLDQIKFRDQQGRITFELRHVDNLVAWRSLFVAELRLRSILLEQPELTVRRDAQGGFHVAGIALAKNGDGSGGDWLLRQTRITVRDARVLWLDEAQKKPALPFEHVEFYLENSGKQHRFSLKATPPAFMATPIDVRGALVGQHIQDLPRWSGELYAQIERADAFAWAYWFPVPEEFNRTSGSLRAWLTLLGNGRHKLIADVRLHEIHKRLAVQLPELNIAKLNGRITWQALEHGFSIEATPLSFALADGFVLPPTDFSLLQTAAVGAEPARFELKTSAFELAHLHQLSVYLPLDEQRRRQLADYAPQGRFQHLRVGWHGAIDEFKRYHLQTKFAALSLQKAGDLPGFSGLSGMLDADETGGSVILDAPGLHLDAPRFLPAPLTFDRFDMQATWRRQPQGWEFKINQAHLANADLEGSVMGSYLTDRTGLGTADVNVNLSRGSVVRAADYIPLGALDEETHNWLKTGLQGGEASQLSLILRGDLDDFPFPENRAGLFQIKAKAQNVAIDYVPGWPRVEKANADLLIEGRQLQVSSNYAVLAGAPVQQVTVTLPDMLSDSLHLRVKGEAAGPVRQTLHYVNTSPLRPLLKNFTRDITATGDGKLSLQLDIPLSGTQPIKVTGKYRFNENEIDLGKDIPTLQKVSGELLFNEAELKAQNIAALVYNGPAHLSIRTEQDGRLNVAAEGKLNLDDFWAVHPAPVSHQLSGSTHWKTKVSVLDDDALVQVTSDLIGINSELPSPLAKRRNEAVPALFEMKNLSATRDQLTLQYGKTLKAILARELDKHGQWPIKRGQISVGGGSLGKPPETDGISINGTLPVIALDDWLAVGLSAPGNDPTFELPPVTGIDLSVTQLSLFGSELNSFKVSGQTRKGVFSAQLSSHELNGEAIWNPQGKGRLAIHLPKASLVENPPPPAPKIARTDTLDVKRVRKLNIPAIDVTVDALAYRRNPLGKFNFQISQTGQDILLDRLEMTNADGTLSASGKWDLLAAQSHLNFKLELFDAGNVLGRSGYPDAIQSARGTLNCDLLWAGGPDELDLANLNGDIQLQTGKGRFLKVSPGAGKLLSVLNLQALPKRILLDFGDVFSSGFEFDTIEGTAKINQGLLTTRNFTIDGSAAKVQMSGQVDLKRETQALRVRIAPKLNNSVSLLAFAGGPVVGASVFLASKLLSDPLDKLASFEYNVSGNWADPAVEKISSGKSTQPPSSEKPKE